MDAPLELPDWLAAALAPLPPRSADPDRLADLAPKGEAEGAAARRVHAFEPDCQAVPGLPTFAGVRVYPEALSPTEAGELLRTIDAVPFVPSQSGKRKQHFGPRFNFLRRRMNADRFTGLPAWAHALEARLRECVARDDRGDPADLAACRAALADYSTTDAFVLRYVEAERSNLDFHVDDLHAYGEAILDVSLDSDSVLSFLGPDLGPAPGASETPPAEALVCVRVPLPARSIAVVYGPARRAWQHAILAGDVRGVRTSITLRTLAPALRETPAGRLVLERARRTA